MRPEESISKNGSIAERLALLKNNGENNWRKRVTKKETNDDIKRDSFVSVSIKSHVQQHLDDNHGFFHSRMFYHQLLPKRMSFLSQLYVK